MKVLRIIPVVAMVFALVAAFAFKLPQATNFYGVASVSGTGYVVAEEVNGETENIHYECQTTATRPCTVSATAVYTPGQTIPFAQATVVINNKAFVDLDPGQ